MAHGQRKQKFGRDVKISLDLTKKELKRFDHARMMLSRSDFLSILLAWFEETTTGSSTGDRDSIMLMNRQTGEEYWFLRQPEGFKLTKIEVGSGYIDLGKREYVIDHDGQINRNTKDED
jgi:hypothetical protein